MDSLYENDYEKWLERQKALLLSKNFDDLDINNLVEELEEMGDSNFKALESYLEILILHLLKWNYQKTVLKDDWVEDRVAHLWLSSIDYSRLKIEEKLEEKPALKIKVKPNIEIIYNKALRLAIKEMNRYSRSENQKINIKSFPDNCPWSFEEMITEDWLPENKI